MTVMQAIENALEFLKVQGYEGGDIYLDLLNVKDRVEEHPDVANISID